MIQAQILDFSFRDTPLLAHIFFLTRAMQVPPTSVTVVAMVPGSVVATLSIAVIDKSQPAATMYATLQVNSATAFDSAFMTAFGITGLSMQQKNLSASLSPFLPMPPPAPPLAAGKSVDTSPSGTGATPTGTVTATPAGAAAATPAPSPGNTSSSASASTTVIVLATVLSVVGAALVATVAVVLVRKNKNKASTNKLTASPSDRAASAAAMVLVHQSGPSPPSNSMPSASSSPFHMPSVEGDEGRAGVRQGSHLHSMEDGSGAGGMRSSSAIAAREGSAIGAAY